MLSGPDRRRSSVRDNDSYIGKLRLLQPLPARPGQKISTSCGLLGGSRTGVDFACLSQGFFQAITPLAPINPGDELLRGPDDSTIGRCRRIETAGRMAWVRLEDRTARTLKIKRVLAPLRDGLASPVKRGVQGFRHFIALTGSETTQTPASKTFALGLQGKRLDSQILS